MYVVLFVVHMPHMIIWEKSWEQMVKYYTRIDKGWVEFAAALRTRYIFSLKFHFMSMFRFGFFLLCFNFFFISTTKLWETVWRHVPGRTRFRMYLRAKIVLVLTRFTEGVVLMNKLWDNLNRFLLVQYFPGSYSSSKSPRTELGEIDDWFALWFFRFRSLHIPSKINFTAQSHEWYLEE